MRKVFFNVGRLFLIGNWYKLWAYGLNWWWSKGWVTGPNVPKIQALPGWGGSDPCLDFFEGFVHLHSGPSKVIIHHPKVIIFPTKVFLFPRNHINLTFSLSKMIYALWSKNVTSRIYAILWAKSPKRKLLSLSFIIPLWSAEPLTAKKKRKKAETHVSCPWFYKTKQKMKGDRGIIYMST